MLEVQLCRRSLKGFVIPVAREDSPEFVKFVAEAILKRMEDWEYGDEVLDAFAANERRSLRDIIKAEL